MQSTILIVALFFFTMAVAQNVTKVPPCTAAKPCKACEVRDCDTDDQCKGNLICADQHKDQLKKRGLDLFKGRCTNTVPNSWEVCIPPKWLVPPKKECEIDCDADYDCQDGLLCAEKHVEEILPFGYSDRRKVYCTPPYSFGSSKGTNQLREGIGKLEVCYDPKKLVKNATKV